MKRCEWKFPVAMIALALAMPARHRDDQAAGNWPRSCRIRSFPDQRTLQYNDDSYGGGGRRRLVSRLVIQPGRPVLANEDWNLISAR